MGGLVPTDDVVGLLRDPETEVGEQAAWVLGFTASVEVVDRIAPLLGSSDPDLRHRALRALGLLKARGRRADVLRQLRDPSAWVRSEAVSALVRIGDKDDVPTLAALLNDPDRKVRVDAAL